MSLAPGTRLGPYEVLAPLGAGGMGEVYSARDTKLDRVVALKVLPDAFACDAERVARFRREAQVLASLNHPHIAAIHGLEESGDTRALVLELVEGPTLMDRLRHGPLPVDEALAIARQVAEALEAAHEHSIVHRDLKPSNVKVTDDGTVKLLDFGLAKALEPESPPSGLTSSPTRTSGGTRAGVILGTAPYMSPEQARGKTVDKRSDIWSFGCMLFEMLTGQPAFRGETTTDVLTAIIAKEPDWDALRAVAPPRIYDLARRCLKKDARERLRDIGDARIEIAEAAREPPGPVVASTTARPNGWRRRDRVVTLAAGVVLGSLGAYGIGLRSRVPMTQQTPASQWVTRFTVPVPAGFSMNGRFPSLAISPDGSRLVYKSARRLWLRDLNQFDAQPIAGSEDATEPFFSHDGAWLAFARGGELVKMSPPGGPLGKIADAVGGGGATWTVDGRIVFAAGVIGNLGLWQVPEEGGQPRQLTTLDESAAETSHLWPHALPDGAVLYTALGPSAKPDDARLVVVDPAGTRTVVAEGLTYGRYVGTRRSGHLLALDGSGTLLLQPFDVRERRITGAARAVLSEVRKSDLGGSGAYALSTSGTLVYATGTELEADLLLQSDWSGKEVRRFGAPRAASYPALSPDGRTLALLIRTSTNDDIHLLDLATGRFDRFTFESSQDEQPVWSPDGRHIAYTAAWVGAQQRVFVKKLASSDAAQLVYTAKKHIHVTSWSPDGEWLALSEWDVRSSNVWLLSLRDPAKLLPVATSAADEVDAVFSPDGKWLAYNSDETGRREVYVVSFPDLAIKRQVSQEGGLYPNWSPTGQELYLFNPTPPVRMVVARRAGPGTLEWQDPVSLFEAQRATWFAVARDGRSFYYPAPNPDAPAREIHVAVNWLDEVARDVDAHRR